MSLLDAPAFDEVAEKRKTKILLGSLIGFVVLFIAYWFVCSRPIDAPWRWHQYLLSRIAVNRFFTDLEKNDTAAAYGVWQNDKNWQQHPEKYKDEYTYDRFQKDWSSESPDNDYGTFHSHRIAAAAHKGNQIMVAAFINDRKSKAINLVWSPEDHTLGFQRDDIQFLEGPGGIQ